MLNMAVHLKVIHNIKNYKDDSKIYSSNYVLTQWACMAHAIMFQHFNVY